VDRGKLTAFGINLFSLGGANTIGNTSTQQFGNTGLATKSKLTGRPLGGPLSGGQATGNDFRPFEYFSLPPDINFGAVIKDLQTEECGLPDSGRTEPAGR